MRIPACVAFALLSTSLFCASASAGSRLGEGCDLAVLGAQADAEFMRFDKALREAVSAKDAAALSQLAQFPLRAGKATLNNAGALQNRLADAWPTLQKAINAKKPGELFCNAEGVMYGDGEIWANPGSGAAAVFHITSMNLPQQRTATHSAGANSKVQLACSTDHFQIVIDEQANDTSRYRSWNHPHAAPDDPAIALIGKPRFEGTGSCAHRIWDFRNGNTDYSLSETGCGDGSTPAKAKAQLEVQVGGKSQLKSWCY